MISFRAVFGPHPGHSGDIVAGIPHQPFQIDDLPGLQPLVFFPEGFFIIDGDIGDALFGEQHLDIALDQLELIPVPGDDPYLHILRSPAGQGSDNVIRFIIVHFQGGDPHALEQLDGQGELFFQFRRVAFRCPLYSGNFSVRKVFRDLSKATSM